MRKNNKRIEVGRSISSREKNHIEEKSLDSERERVRRKARVRKTWGTIVMAVLLLFLGALLFIGMKSLIEEEMSAEVEVAEEKKYEPTISIYDENGGTVISERVRDYIGQIEVDLADLGFKVKRAVLPKEKAREVDLYVEGYDFYFKVNIDRGTAESAEDMVRMIKYVTDGGIEKEIGYIDVRVEGKAYYK